MDDDRLVCSLHKIFLSHMGDDSFIFFRYADNFGRGHGLKWNPLDTAVEGFSSPIWTWWLGIWSMWFDIVTVAQVTGLVCMILVAIQILRLVENTRYSLGYIFDYGCALLGYVWFRDTVYTLLLINVFPLITPSLKSIQHRFHGCLWHCWVFVDLRLQHLSVGS